MITLVVAHDLNYNIGKDGQLPWGRLPNDLKFFKEQTIGKNVLMGRKTFESIGKPLPDRENFVITNEFEKWNLEYSKVENITFAKSPDVVLRVQKEFDMDLYVIGGETLYAQFLPHADRIIETLVHGYFDGCDAKFPNPFDYGNWKEKFLGEMPPDKNNRYCVTFRELIREAKEWPNLTINRFI